MPEITVIHIALLAVAAVAGAVAAWVIRGNRSEQEKAAVSLGWQEQIKAQRKEHDRQNINKLAHKWPPIVFVKCPNWPTACAIGGQPAVYQPKRRWQAEQASTQNRLSTTAVSALR